MKLKRKTPVNRTLSKLKTSVQKDTIMKMKRQATDWRNYLQTIYSMNNLYLEYIRTLKMEQFKKIQLENGQMI